MPILKGELHNLDLISGLKIHWWAQETTFQIPTLAGRGHWKADLTESCHMIKTFQTFRPIEMGAIRRKEAAIWKGLYIIVLKLRNCHLGHSCKPKQAIVTVRPKEIAKIELFMVKNALDYKKHYRKKAVQMITHYMLHQGQSYNRKEI